MLGPMILEDPLNILQERDQIDIADEKKDFDQPIDQMEKDTLHI